MADPARHGKAAPVAPIVDVLLFATVAVVASAALFVAVQGATTSAGCPTISAGPFALISGIIIAARGLAGAQKWRPLLVMAAAHGLLVALGAPLLFGLYRLGDVSTAPTSLALITAVPLMFYAAFTFLPWAVPVGVLMVTVGRDPHKLWSSGGRG